MLILGIESSCDETAAAVVEGGRRVRSNVIASQAALHEEYGGVVPEIAARRHVELIVPVVRAALDDAGVGLDEIDAVAVGHKPGLIGALLVGVSAAKALAWSAGVPLIGVDHIEAHLYAALLNDDEWREDDVFPALGLVVSGGHTAMYRLDGPTRISRLGSTIDDAVGEAYDKAAAILGLGYPGGPIVDRRAQRGDDRAHEFPVSRLGTGSLDFSFSGLKTALLYAVRGTPTADGSGSPRYERDAAELSDAQIDDLCASFQRAAVRALRIKLERALDSGRFDGPPRCLVIGGGVAANSRLRAEVEALTHERGLAVRIPAMEHCLDNAAMIAGLGCALAADGTYADLTLHARPRS